MQVQTQIYGAFQFICDHLHHDENTDSVTIRQQASWHLFNFQLLGIGCSPNPEKSLDTLYKAACSDLSWKLEVDHRNQASL